MKLDRVRTVIEKALSASVHGIRVAGIADAAVRKVAVSSEQLQRVAVQLEQRGLSEVKLSAEVELFLRVSNTDVLRSIECTDFCVRVSAEENDLRAVASNEKDWRMAWERGIEPIKQPALQGMRRDVWNMDATLAEDSYTFRAAMVLLASELVGPYVDRIVTFLGYPPGLVQVITARLYEAKIWDVDEARSESWFDPHKGTVAFLLDLMVAEGELIGGWSEEKKQCAYRIPNIMAVSRFAV